MKLEYHYCNNNIPPGIVLKKLSIAEHEEEVLLFPFSFVYVKFLKRINNKYYELYGEIINKDCILEFGLKKGKNVVLKNNILTFE